MRTMAGERPSKVTARYGFHRCTIYGWLKAAQERRVFRWVNGKTPRQYGFDVGV
jgi:transposase